MRDYFKQPALLANLGGPSMPPLALNISAQFQPCVDAGALAASLFFDDLTAVGLHDHIAISMHAFMRSSYLHTATVDESSAARQAYVDAFAAGYLGRIQQELRLFHHEGVSGVAACTPAVH